MSETVVERKQREAEELQRAIERWSGGDAAHERKQIFRSYNEVFTVCARIKFMAQNSNFLTKEEKVALEAWAQKLFWMSPELSGLVPGAVDAASDPRVV